MGKETVSADKFDYPAFRRDLMNRCKAEKTTLGDLSVNILFRSRSYLSNSLSTGSLTLPMITRLAQWLGEDLIKYSIKPKKPEPEVVLPDNPMVSSGWSCEVKVEKDFGVALMRVIKDGNTVVTGRSFLYGLDDVGIIQSISYAAHMCYKLVQQDVIEEIKEGKAPERIIYKDWVKKYEEANSVFGCLARYIQAHYKNFPSTGKKDMHVYLLQHEGGAHINAFKVSFDQYMDWYKSNYK